MARKSGSRKTKRAAAPAFQRFPRKKFRFTATTSPGPHPKSASYPLAIFMRDVQKLVKNYREAELVLKEGRVLVDGVVRRDPAFPVGLMDIIEVPSIEKVYRIVVKEGERLETVEVPPSEGRVKLCKVNTRGKAKGGVIQLGLHDGRSMLMKEGTNLKPGDSCIIEVPSQKLLGEFEMKAGNLAMVISGKRAGQYGGIEGLKPGAFSTAREAIISLAGSSTSLPVDHIVVIGSGTPAVTLFG